MTQVEIGGVWVNVADPTVEHLLLARAAFVDRYCAERAWNRAALTIDQILEIRQQAGWQVPDQTGGA